MVPITLEAASITSGVAEVLTIATQCVTFITGNPLCLIFIGAALLGLGFKVFTDAKSASNG